MKITNIKNILKHFVPDRHIDGIANELLCIINNAIVEEREANGWKPITTAPSDGTKILLYRSIGGTPDMAVCYWRNDCVIVGWTCGFGQAFRNATHWKPLAAAPKDEVSE